MTHHEPVRSGAALLEVIVALAIAALVLATAREVLVSLDAGASRLAAAATEMDRAGNAERYLRTLIGQTESATVVRGAVAGAERSVRLETWCDMPAGWKERCSVELRFDVHDGAEALVASGVPGGPLVLRRGFMRGEWLYLADPARGGTWLSGWAQQVTTPLALAAVLDGDTLIFRIGERG